MSQTNQPLPFFIVPQYEIGLATCCENWIIPAFVHDSFRENPRDKKRSVSQGFLKVRQDYHRGSVCPSYRLPHLAATVQCVATSRFGGVNGKVTGLLLWVDLVFYTQPQSVRVSVLTLACVVPSVYFARRFEKCAPK
jgi:hypothetical protein